MGWNLLEMPLFELRSIHYLLSLHLYVAYVSMTVWFKSGVFILIGL